MPMARLTGAAQMDAEYKRFLDQGRTPSRVVDLVRGESRAFREVDLFDVTEPRVAAGDRLLFVNADRTAILVVIGDAPVASAGVRLVGAHIDTPSPRLTITGLTRKNQVRIQTHRYGGMRTHHWPGIPLAVVGRVAPAGGPEIDISLGLEDDDFAFHVTRKGSDLVLVTSMGPTNASETSVRRGNTSSPEEMTNASETSVRTFVDLLHARYGLTAADLEAAELYLVPRHRARDVGLDRGLIGAHGQDDRVNSYAAWRALVDLDGTPERTAMVWLVDREEVGSTGRTGAEARFFELVMAWLLRAQGQRATEAAMHRALAASQSLSADTPAAVNPNFPEVHDHANAPVLGKGPALFPYTGGRGKRGGSAARAELVADVIAAFERAKVPLQYGTLGRVDEGGGGTIAKYLAHRGVDVIDVGVSVVSMHSPMEIASKKDVWAAYLGFRAWLAGRTDQ